MTTVCKVRIDMAYVLNTNIHYTNVMNICVVVACDVTQTEVFLLLIILKGVLQLPGLPLDHVRKRPCQDRALHEASKHGQ